jgi:hypothetical protein
MTKKIDKTNTKLFISNKTIDNPTHIFHHLKIKLRQRNISWQTVQIKFLFQKLQDFQKKKNSSTLFGPNETTE